MDLSPDLREGKGRPNLARPGEMHLGHRLERHREECGDREEERTCPRSQEQQGKGHVDSTDKKDFHPPDEQIAEARPLGEALLLSPEHLLEQS